jgi:hypothetical protein
VLTQAAEQVSPSGGSSNQTLWGQLVDTVGPSYISCSKILLVSSKPVGPGGPTGIACIRHWSRPKAHRRAPCTTTASSSVIRPSSKVTLRTGNACCKTMFQVFHMFHLDVAIVSCGCYKNRSGCCICCNGCTRMLQAFVPNISVVFPDVCSKCVYLNVTRVSHICCMCFIWMLYIFCNGFFKHFQLFLQVFQTYVASVSTVFECILQMFYLDVF